MYVYDSFVTGLLMFDEYNGIAGYYSSGMSEFPFEIKRFTSSDGFETYSEDLIGMNQPYFENSGAKGATPGVGFYIRSNYVIPDSVYFQKTSDFGASWETEHLVASQAIWQGMYFVNDELGYTVGSDLLLGSVIEVTNDGGETFNTEFSTFDVPSFYDVCFPTSTTGFVVGAEGVIYKKQVGSHNAVNNNAQNAALNIYPNPAQHTFTIECDLLPIAEKIEIFAANGTIVKQCKVENKIEVTNLPDGIYQLKISGEFGLINKPFIVQH